MPGSRRRLGRDDVVAGRRDVRLEPEVARGAAGGERAERRRLRAGARAAVVRALLVAGAGVAGERVVVVHVVVLRRRADADRLRGRARRLVDAAEEGAGVPGRCDEDRPVLHGEAVQHQADEVDVRAGVEPRRARVRAEAQVDDVRADRARRRAGRHRGPLQRGEQVAVDPRAGIRDVPSRRRARRPARFPHSGRCRSRAACPRRSRRRCPRRASRGRCRRSRRRAERSGRRGSSERRRSSAG